MTNPKKKHRKSVLPILGLILGIFIIAFYPAADLYSSIRYLTQKTRIEHAVSQLDKEDLAEYLSQADLYNTALATGASSETIRPYEDQLSVSGSDQPFATLMIPKISLTISIYHGTSAEVLANGAGHLKGTSLPVGGTSTHAVLTAHSGMTGMRAFDDIRDLETGDQFLIEVLGKKIAYRVYKTETVLPEEVTDRVHIREGEDLCTLLTCTPYGINDHRLLVYGKRCPYSEGLEKVKPSVENVAGNRRLWPLEITLLLLIFMAVSGIPGKVSRKWIKKQNEKD